MTMPNKELAVVQNEKITAYLLNETHATGKTKAAFFKNFGFDLTDIDRFKKALTVHAIEREIETMVENDFGMKYELKCALNTPDGRNPCIITVWIIENKQPRLVTAYPA